MNAPRGPRARWAAALGAAALVLGGCGGMAGTAGGPRPGSTTTTTRVPGHRLAAGTLDGLRIGSRTQVAPTGTALTDVSCPATTVCEAVTGGDQSYRWSGPAAGGTGAPTWSGPVTIVAGATGSGDASRVACPTAAFCMAIPSFDQAAALAGTTWSAPATLSGAQGLQAVGCASPTFCVAIDGEGNAFDYDGSGWAGSDGAWGGADDVSCASATFCVATEGGPSVWNGSSWSQPGQVDQSGQLVGVSCTSPRFCVAVDNTGAVFEWTGTAWLGPRRVLPDQPGSTGGGTGGGAAASGVSCTGPTFCVAVDATGLASVFDGTDWSPPVRVDPKGGVAAVSCPAAGQCMVVDSGGGAVLLGPGTDPGPGAPGGPIAGAAAGGGG